MLIMTTTAVVFGKQPLQTTIVEYTCIGLIILSILMIFVLMIIHFFNSDEIQRESSSIWYTKQLANNLINRSNDSNLSTKSNEKITKEEIKQDIIWFIQFFNGITGYKIVFNEEKFGIDSEQKCQEQYKTFKCIFESNEEEINNGNTTFLSSTESWLKYNNKYKQIEPYKLKIYNEDLSNLLKKIWDSIKAGDKKSNTEDTKKLKELLSNLPKVDYQYIILLRFILFFVFVILMLLLASQVSGASKTPLLNTLIDFSY